MIAFALRHPWVRRGLIVVYCGIGLMALFSLLYPEIRHRQQLQTVEDLLPLVLAHAASEELEIELVMAVILIESGGRPWVRSGKDAIGLMQVRRIAEADVARLRRGVEAGGDLYDPDYNVQIGCAYLRILLDRFKEDELLALAAYNRGPTEVARWRRQYPELPVEELIARQAPRETRQYCKKVLAARAEFRERHAAGEEARLLVPRKPQPGDWPL